MLTDTHTHTHTHTHTLSPAVSVPMNNKDWLIRTTLTTCHNTPHSSSHDFTLHVLYRLLNEQRGKKTR